LATGHFEEKFFLKIAGSDPDGSNDTGLKFVSCPGAEPIEPLLGYRATAQNIFLKKMNLKIS
jgi:hypothetical protein